MTLTTVPIHPVHEEMGIPVVLVSMLAIVADSATRDWFLISRFTFWLTRRGGENGYPTGQGSDL